VGIHIFGRANLAENVGNANFQDYQEDVWVETISVPTVSVRTGGTEMDHSLDECTGGGNGTFGVSHMQMHIT